jgi:acetyl-CoA synthetase
MRDINLRYIRETFDEKGNLKHLDIDCPDSFNFAYDIVDDIAINDPDRRALIWTDESGAEKIFTFADIKRMSDKTCNYFASKGIAKGDFVMLVLKNNYQFWYIITALHKMGAVPVPATFMLKPHDIDYRIRAASIKAAVVTSLTDAADSFDAAESTKELSCKFIVGGKRDGWLDFDSEVEKYSDKWERVPTHKTDRFLMYFTSGTSDNPKMAVHDQTYPLGHILLAKYWHQVDPDGIHWTVADTGWAKTAWGRLYSVWLMEGASFVFEFDRFDPHKILAMIEKYRITTFCCPPTMFRLYLNAGVEGYDLSSLKNCCIAGEALNPDTFNKWEEATGLRLMEAFGQTESSVIVGTIKGMTPKPGSMGRPSPQYRVEIVDEDGEPCEVGEEGEIVVSIEPRVPGIFVEYYRDPEKTAFTLRDGWHHTGDVAWKDEDGYYWYSGRNDDIIKSSGYRISPFEVESCALEHPAVLECAVTGVPDPVRGQLVKATIVLREGYEPTDELKKEIQDYVKHNTAPYKYPRVVEFAKELPKSISGKVKRVDIRRKDAA